MGRVIDRRRVMGGKSLPYDAEIEYLESSGKQWIDTGYVPKIGDSVRMIFRLTRLDRDTYDQIMGAGTGSYQFCFPTGLSDKGTGIWCRPWQGGTGYGAPFLRSNSVVPDYIIDFTVKHLSGSNYRISVGSDYINTTAMSEIDGLVEQRNLLIFRRPNVGNSWIKCFAFQLWDANSVLIRDIIPVRIGNVGYMYDKVSKQLLGNSGTGAFILGPDK